MSEKRSPLSVTHHSLLIPHHLIKTSADEMDNLYAVAFGQCGLLPVGAADDFAVAFDRQTFGRERESPDEGKERLARFDFAAFSVDFDAKEFYQPLSAGLYDASHFGILATDDCAHEDGGAARGKARQRRENDGHSVAVRSGRTD